MSRTRAAAGAVARLAVVVALAASLSGCRGGAMTPYRFGKDADSLSSLAAEGAVLADGVADGRTTSAFVRTHAQELASDTEKLSSVVASTRPQPALVERTDRLSALALHVARRLRALADHPADRARAVVLRAAFSDAADAATKLGNSV